MKLQSQCEGGGDNELCSILNKKALLSSVAEIGGETMFVSGHH
jgi:hypothetical protein